MSEVKNYKVIIVDDHSLFSQSLKFLINSFDKFEVINEFGNGKVFVNYLQEHPDVEVDLVLLDINMPVMDGLSTMRWLKNHRRSLKVIALSVNEDELVIIKMMKNGVRGYLLKDTSPQLFQDALEIVANNGFYFTEMVTGILVNKVADADKLKDKEIEFIRLACSELTYKEIAIEMCLSPRTIDGYRESIFSKLKIKTRIGLVLYAIKNRVYLSD